MYKRKEDTLFDIHVSSFNQYECSPEHGLRLIVEGQTLACYYGGQEVEVKVVTADWLHEGSIICPKCTEVCQVRGALHYFFSFNFQNLLKNTVFF